jgi:cob(I)alamin adenosyltransferase
MKIYTRTGDTGETALFAGGRVSKGHVRLHSYGTVDELNAILGLAWASRSDETVETLWAAVIRVQSELFVVGADLATPLDAKTEWIVRVSSQLVGRLEGEIDEWEASLPALKNFILPGGSLSGAFLHQARTVCRRAERWIVMLYELEPVNPEVLRYVNRLSDWLFVAARVVNQRAGQPETTWQKGTK